jgi:hypothetical protein
MMLGGLLSWASSLATARAIHPPPLSSSVFLHFSITSLLHFFTSTSASIHSLKFSETMEEDFNLPGPERASLLKLLQEAIGDVPPHFWAACQVCDLEALKDLVIVASVKPAIIVILATNTFTILQYCM